MSSGGNDDDACNVILLSPSLCNTWARKVLQTYQAHGLKSEGRIIVLFINVLFVVMFVIVLFVLYNNICLYFVFADTCWWLKTWRKASSWYSPYFTHTVLVVLLRYCFSGPPEVHHHWSSSLTFNVTKVQFVKDHTLFTALRQYFF